MLRELRIGNLALVDEIVIPFTSGLTIMTGETGAGKSLIAGSLGLLCGRKADKDQVRQGEDAAYVEGLFDLAEQAHIIQELHEIGIRVAPDGILVLRRELRRQGRSRVLINGLLSSLALLEQIGPLLMSVMSQDQQRELSDPRFAQRLLDTALDLAPLVSDLSDKRRIFLDLQDQLASRLQEQAFADEQLDSWEYQHRELVAATLDMDEEALLAERITVLQNASSLQAGAARALQTLTGEPTPVRSGIGTCIGLLGPLAEQSRKIAEVLESLQQAEDATAEAASQLSRFLDTLNLDQADLDELQQRKALYEELRRKYQRDVAGLLQLQESLAERITRAQAADSDLTGLRTDLANAREDLENVGCRLHQARKDGAETVSGGAIETIRRLSLPGLELRFSVELCAADSGPITVDGTRCAVGASGADTVRIFVRTNPGERMGEVAAIASGGEKSRIYLGLIAMQRPGSDEPLLLLDEIDSGLGMDTALPVAKLLEDLACCGQVVCITHLPTMAVHGRSHVKVYKETHEERTVLRALVLAGGERVAEIARLLGGEGYAGGNSKAQLSYAAQLLAAGNEQAAAAAGLTAHREDVH